MLRDSIGGFPRLAYCEKDKKDPLHFARPFPEYMLDWIKDLKEGETAFDNPDETKPYQLDKNGNKIVNKGAYMGNKYRRLIWDRPGACIATRSDILSSQDTIHPCDNRVLSIRELMTLMTIPNSFQWTDHDSELTVENSDEYLKDNEGNIRRCIGEAVPTQIGRDIAEKISLMLDYEDFVNSGEGDKTSNFFIDAHKAFGEILPNAAFNEINKQKEDVENVSVKVIGIGDFLTFIPQLISYYSHINSITIDVFNLSSEEEVKFLSILGEMKIGSNVSINIPDKTAEFESYNLIVENGKCRHFFITETGVKRTTKKPQADPLQLSLF
jgi:DNA (cytosine-5)-methyltransferase 1